MTEAGNPTIIAARGVLPEHRYPQPAITAAFAELAAVDDHRRRLLQQVHHNAGVRFRHLALPLDEYGRLTDFDTANGAFISSACELSATALLGAINQAGIRPDDIDLIITASTTGLAVPSIEARIVYECGLRPDVKRIPIVGLGCAAGAAGVARLADYLVGHRSEVAAFISVELCSLTLQHSDDSVANLIASGLFGDGAAAVLMAGDPDRYDENDGCRPAVLATRSRLYRNTERVMGWDVGSAGLRIVLGAEIPDLVRSELADDVDGFLADQGLSRSDVGWWVCHPGGPKVLEAIQDSLDLSSNDLRRTWTSLAEVGNLSSASVLHVLDDALHHDPPAPGTYGLMLALGPGFALEQVLLRA